MAALDAALARCAGRRGTHGRRQLPDASTPPISRNTAYLRANCGGRPGRPRNAVSTWRPAPARGKAVREALLHGTRKRRCSRRSTPSKTAPGSWNFSHNNLRAGTCAGRAGGSCPLRYHDAISPFGRRRGLRKPARTGPPDGRSDVLGDTGGRHTPHRRLTGHRWTSPRLRRAGASRTTRVRVRGHGEQPRNPGRSTHLGRGFPRRTRRGETPSGMGLIDRQGRYVILPNTRSSTTRRPKASSRVAMGGIRLPGTTPDEFGTNND